MRSFTGTTLAKTGRQLDELASTLARGRTRRNREQLLTEIGKITSNDWVKRLLDAEPATDCR